MANRTELLWWHLGRVLQAPWLTSLRPPLALLEVAGERGGVVLLRRGKRATEPAVGADDDRGSPQRADTDDDRNGDGDRTDPASWAVEVEPDPTRAAELAERFRSRTARIEAQRDLLRLRDRHWSGERLVEEGRTPQEWWEHPEADPYAVLGLLPGAPLADAAAARRLIARDFHPDRVAPVGDQATPEAAEVALRRMVAANAAYDRLRRALNPIQ